MNKSPISLFVRSGGINQDCEIIMKWEDVQQTGLVLLEVFEVVFQCLVTYIILLFYISKKNIYFFKLKTLFKQFVLITQSFRIRMNYTLISFFSRTRQVSIKIVRLFGMEWIYSRQDWYFQNFLKQAITICSRMILFISKTNLHYLIIKNIIQSIVVNIPR